MRAGEEKGRERGREGAFSPQVLVSPPPWAAHVVTRLIGCRLEIRSALCWASCAWGAGLGGKAGCLLKTSGPVLVSCRAKTAAAAGWRALAGGARPHTLYATGAGAVTGR